MILPVVVETTADIRNESPNGFSTGVKTLWKTVAIPIAQSPFDAG